MRHPVDAIEAGRTIAMNDDRPIRIAAVGDVMLGDSPQVFGCGVGSMIERHGPGFPFTHVVDALNGYDVVVANLEIVISGYDPATTPFQQRVYRAQPRAVEGLVSAGIDVVSACTNHMMQHGRAAVEQALESLDLAGIAVIGIEMPERGVTNASILERRGVRLGFLGYNFRPQQYFVDPPQWPQPTVESILDDVARIRDGVDRTVVTLHWGDEFIEYPSPEQVDLAHRLIDGGVDVIIGHHTHMLQGVERYNGGVIAYGLGNFVYDQWQPRLRRSMILDLTLGHGDAPDFEIRPVRINRRHQPEVVDGDEGRALKREIAALARKIGTVGAEEYRADVRRNYKRFRREVCAHYLTHVFRYDVRDLRANIVGAIRRRM